MNIFWQRLVRDHPRLLDVAVALLLFANAYPGSLLDAPGGTTDTPWWPAMVLAGLSCVALQWRRERPRATAALAIVCAVAMAALGYLLTVLLLGPLMVAFYTLADRTDRRTANTFTFFAMVILPVTDMLAATPGNRPLSLEVIGPAAWLLVPTALGTATRLRRDYLEAVNARAEHAERTREEEARHRVAEERVRIARELHDVVAHHLALANAQAGTVAHLLRTRPEQAERILADLTGTTSSALRELKATVGLLRRAGDSDAPLEPSPGLSRLPELTASFATAGLDVTVTTEGRERRLSPGVDLTAYRIVQEALTNVTKHAMASAAHVGLAYSRDRLTVTVTNDAGAPGAVLAGVGAPRSGFGLIGMRERAQSIGGNLQTGHRPEGGFSVTAALPLYPDGQDEGAAG
jgi:signal transduction histidine kinase